MYIVEWCDHEGNLQQQEFRTLRDSKLEAAWLEQRYDGVEIKKTVP